MEKSDCHLERSMERILAYADETSYLAYAFVYEDGTVSANPDYSTHTQCQRSYLNALRVRNLSESRRLSESSTPVSMIKGG